MNELKQKIGVLIVSHGSPRAEANRAFREMVERIAARLDSANVLPTFFSIARPDIPERAAILVERGIRRIVLMPFFLGAGQHVTSDIPAILEQCRQQFPGITFELLATLEGEPALEDLIVDRLAPLVAAPSPMPADGQAIERRSYELIEQQLHGVKDEPPEHRAIIRRIIHATADVSFARSVRIHPEAVERGRATLAAERPILCDVRMLQAGITRVRSEVVCAIDQEEVAALARQKGCTRAAAAMELLSPQLDGAIVAIGNAPTALWKVLEIAAAGPRPALVVGLPVGFVWARESKLALLESGLCYITNTSARGGSPVAAAAINALAMLEKGEE